MIKLNRLHEVNKKLDIVPSSCIINGNQRKEITVELTTGKKAVVIGINPSIACNDNSDTTLTKISRYLESYGVGKIVMVNLFDTISTEQSGIDQNQNCNLQQYEAYFLEADLIVVAWGTENKYSREKEKAFSYLVQFEDKVYCIEDKKGNKPRHPSRMSYTDDLVKFF